jgi:hypothetical protein
MKSGPDLDEADPHPLHWYFIPSAGRVLDKTQPEDRIHIKARLVKFSWQRGVKIGRRSSSVRGQVGQLEVKFRQLEAILGNLTSNWASLDIKIVGGHVKVGRRTSSVRGQDGQLEVMFGQLEVKLFNLTSSWASLDMKIVGGHIR